jgi:two-component system sensor histidine kinase HupT/HoxJ
VQPHAVQQALVNILLNALDAVADVPEPRLAVGTSSNHDHCRIWVRDNGPGVDAKDQRRIFEPFVTTKPVGKGTGLGLAISHKLIRSQGGRIKVESDSGRGATFIIELPIRPHPSQSQDAPARDASQY